ncbi:Nodulation protein F [Mesorhizobium plurifarium]|uniref:Nodulation protein F n=1 Tax=Mesorhizobium plurifarium TaxID=69974 RepID=A0A090G670_MESPL|nr:Nodulation protein F [Mesorhizobium plurifarium]
MTDQLTTEILAEICEHAEPDANPITLENLGIHSLEMADILFDLGKNHGIQIESDTTDAWSNLQNVGSVVEAVRALDEH